MTWQIRSEALLGAEKLALLRSAHVAVFGLGGVGSWAAEALVRTGVGQVTLIDGDTTEESNLNRQLPALRSSLGRYKADILESRFLDINPELQVHKHNCFYRPGEGNSFLQGLDLVLDCIDDLPAKADLIAACADRDLPLLTAGGCGFRLETQGLVLADIFETAGDPMLKRLRKLLRDRGLQSASVVYFTSPLYPRSGQQVAPEPADHSQAILQAGLSQAGQDQSKPADQAEPTKPAPASGLGPTSAIFAPASCGLEMARLAVLHLIGDQPLSPPRKKLAP